MAKPHKGTPPTAPEPEEPAARPEPIMGLIDFLDEAVGYQNEGGNRAYTPEALRGFGRTVEHKGWAHAPAREWKARLEAWLATPV